MFCGVGLDGTLKLEEKFDPMWFVPKSTYLHRYITERSAYYPSMGFEAGIFMGQLNYNEEFNNIQYLVSKFENSTDILQVTNSWVEPFYNYVKKNFNKGEWVRCFQILPLRNYLLHIYGLMYFLKI